MQNISEDEVYKNNILYDMETGRKGIHTTYMMIEKLGDKSIYRPVTHVFDCEYHMQCDIDKTHYCHACGKLRELNISIPNKACPYMCDYRISVINGVIKKIHNSPWYPNKKEDLDKYRSMLKEKYWYTDKK